MTKFKLLLFIALLVGFASPAYAGFDEGQAAYKKGDYATAYKEFKTLADRGDSDAQWYLDVMYALGVGFAALAHAGYDEGRAAYESGDYATAYKEFKSLAEQGNG
jgi:hypothetical protein